MGRKVVKIAPELIAQYCVTGCRFGDDQRITWVQEGVPADAVHLLSWHDGRHLVLLFEHPDWPQVKANEEYPVLEVNVRTIKTSNSWTWLPDEQRSIPYSHII